MALYNTVPAEESTLLAPPKTTTTKSWKGLVALAAVASFALGAVAATASSTANDAAHGNGYCGKGDLAQPPKPYMDLNFYDWYVLGDDKLGSYWEFPSNQCNYLCSGSAKDCTWFVELDGNKGQCSGTDLCDSMDWNNICPF